MIAASMIAMACGTMNKTGEAALTTAFDDQAWGESEWISVSDAPVVQGIINGNNCRAADGANWFLCNMRNEKKVTKALWMTTGLGIYYLYVNGKPVGEEILKPGFTHFEKTKRSFTYDITNLLDLKKEALNVLSAQVTPGWWADKIITPDGHQGMVGKKCAFRGVLELTFSDGTTKRYGTNRSNWKAGIAGPVRHAAIFDGEEYDARVPMGYATAEHFSTPEVNTEFGGEILPSAGAEVYLRKDLALKPAKAYKWKGVTGASDEEYGKVVVTKDYAAGEEMSIIPGETLIIDFGQNCSAQPSFVFKAKEGTVLTCLPAELLNDGNGAKSRGMDGPEGSCHRLNLRIPDLGMRLLYTFGHGDDYVAYQPTCTFFGYRYISVTANDEVSIKSVESVPVTSITKEMETGSITTGNESVNKLLSNTYWGMLSNYLSIPTDCPQRNERLGWTADTQVFSETGTFFANTAKFFHKWMRDMRDSQGEQGGFPGVAPAGQYGNEKMRLGWADAGIIVPWTVWKQFGETEIINENWQAMERYMRHVDESKYDHEALKGEHQGYQWADWLSYEPLESCSGKAWDQNGLLPDAQAYWNYLGASYWAIDALMMADMAVPAGHDPAPYLTMADKARAYLKEEFMNADGTFKTDILNTMQTPALFALRNHLVEGEAKEEMKARLRKNFADHGNCLQTGFLGTSILMATLTENGMEDVAYELLFQRKNPSWLYSIDNGATTIWERWNSYMKDVGMGPKGMNSFNHYAYGCVCQWIWETVAGIAADPRQPGFKHILMQPIPDKRLGHVEAEYNSAAGLIKSAWRYEGDNWIWEFTIPQGATASVTLPGENEAKEYREGAYTISKRIR